MAFTPQTPQINERIFQQQPQTPPPRPTYLPGRVVNSPDDIRASEIPMDGTVAVFPASDYSYVVLKAWNSNGSIQTEIYQHVNPNAEKQEDPKFEEFKMALNEISGHRRDIGQTRCAHVKHRMILLEKLIFYKTSLI